MNKLGPFELNRIYMGDAANLLTDLPEACIDLAVTSPPYDNLRDYKDYTFDFEPIAAELYRVTKPGGMVVWVVGDATVDGSETGTSFRQALGFMGLGFNLHDTMIYEKNGASYPSQDKYYQTFEFMFVFSKGKPKAVHLLKDRKNLWGGSWGRRSRRNVKGELIAADNIVWDDTGVRFNVWRYNTGKGFSTKDKVAFEHPAIFPEALARDHIISWSIPGDVVLDPMCGSGTTLKMAMQAGRQYLGFDISEEYCNLARRRVGQANPPLFVI